MTPGRSVNFCDCIGRKIAGVGAVGEVTTQFRGRTRIGVNRLLALLPRDEYQRLHPHLERITLPKRTVLYEPGDSLHHAYFPLSGIVSLLATTQEGHAVEVAMVGNEGVIGLPIIFQADTVPYQVMVQITGVGYRIRSEVLRTEFRRAAALQAGLLRYTHGLLGQISQSAVCHQFHTASQRLCRSLLLARERVDSDTLELTQEFMSYMLGIPRTAVNAAAVELQDGGAIRYRHGTITILNRHRLETWACECYQILRDDIGQCPPAAAV